MFDTVHHSIFMENTIARDRPGRPFPEEFAHFLAAKKIGGKSNCVQCFRRFASLIARCSPRYALCRAPCTHGRGRGEGSFQPPSASRSLSPHLPFSLSPRLPSRLPPSSFIPAFNKKILVYHGVVQIRLRRFSFFLHSPWKTGVKTVFSGFFGRATS